jgi:hypothetical protein
MRERLTSEGWFRELGLSCYLSGPFGEMDIVKCIGGMWVPHVR